MTYSIYKNEDGYWFKCRSSLAVNHGPFATRAEAKAAADAYVKGWE